MVARKRSEVWAHCVDLQVISGMVGAVRTVVLGYLAAVTPAPWKCE